VGLEWIEETDVRHRLTAWEADMWDLARKRGGSGAHSWA
jgi:hypothetical protein